MRMEKCCCFTGHRPQKLPWGSNEWDWRCVALKERILLLIRELYREGTTILLITHDDGIAATARRVVRLSDGKIIADHPQEVDWA